MKMPQPPDGALTPVEMTFDLELNLEGQGRDLGVQGRDLVLWGSRS